MPVPYRTVLFMVNWMQFRSAQMRACTLSKDMGGTRLICNLAIARCPRFYRDARLARRICSTGPNSNGDLEPPDLKKLAGMAHIGVTVAEVMSEGPIHTIKTDNLSCSAVCECACLWVGEWVCVGGRVWTCLCVSECALVCMCTSACACMFACAYVCIFVCVCVCAYVSVSVSVSVRVCVNWG